MAASSDPEAIDTTPGEAVPPAPPADPPRRTGIPPAGLFVGVAREVAWLVGHLALYPTGLLPFLPAALSTCPAREPAAVPPPAPGTLPVVLVHGLADNRSIFAVLRRALRRAGCASIHPFDHNPLGGDIRTKAELLDLHIAQVCARTGATAVHVVGHSLGGLIARYHAQFVDRGVRVRTVVTLGTPHRGTAAAHLLRAHPLVRELCPDSPVVAELAGPAPGCATRFVAFWGDLDPFVIPLASGALAHPDLDATSVLVPGAGHLTLPACRAVVSEVCALAAAASDAAPVRDGLLRGEVRAAA
ncbi:esterase/lipase family protein [Yinghuangia seranimata]|uniref:esterase/lipase family protein n=1 Tax=Yinghuangia seranimata TaxID=408067 RepID=UPI00248C10B4|nr:alpha/beta fold hydrolase [Yinghuangia seranimata]MDI2126797.1 alpha/beta fold hydrolase [Yinghuangia seranimata]